MTETLTRRAFLTALTAAVATPALPLPFGWQGDSDHLHLGNVHMLLDDTLDLTPWPQVYADSLYLECSEKFPIGGTMLRIGGGQRGQMGTVKLMGGGRAGVALDLVGGGNFDFGEFWIDRGQL